MNRWPIVGAPAVLFATVVIGVGVAPVDGQGTGVSPARTGVSLFVGGGWTDLAGGTGEGGTMRVGPLGGAIERRLAGPWSLRGELLAKGAGAQVTRRGFNRLDGQISRGEVGLAVLVRGYRPSPSGTQLFGALGVSGTAQTYCDVDLGRDSGTFFGETIACEEWEEGLNRSGVPDGGVELHPASTSSSLIVAIGVAEGPLELELRYDHGLGVAVASPEGDMRSRGLAVVLHYRLGAGLR